MRGKQPLLVLTGPTAVGKTAISVRLAKLLDAEIVSADSMQVYRGMDIGTAKVRPEEMDGVPHHMIDVLEPVQECSVADFSRMAKAAIGEAHSRGKIPLLVGGAGFYIQAIVKDVDFSEAAPDAALRTRLEEQANTREGARLLHRQLREVDPESAEKIHPNNVRRVIRALEYYARTGEPISAHNRREREREPAYDAVFFAVTDDREEIYRRIDLRVERMVQDGLVSEVQGLLASGCARTDLSMQGLGYKQIAAFLEGECDLEQAVSLIKRDTRHFAKRQLTWLSREQNVIWIDRRQFGGSGDAEVCDKIAGHIANLWNHRVSL